MSFEISFTDIVEIIMLAALFYWVWTLHREMNSARGLISVETERKVAHLKAFDKLTNVDAIVEEMEAGARMREMHDANRTTLPREPDGPHARVFRPKMRSKLPSRWNPPGPHERPET